MVNSESRHRIQWSLKINLLKVCNNWIMHIYNPFFFHMDQIGRISRILRHGRFNNKYCNWCKRSAYRHPAALNLYKRERKFKFCGRSGLQGNAKIFLVGKRRHHHSNYSTSNSLKMRGRRKKKEGLLGNDNTWVSPHGCYHSRQHPDSELWPRL